MAKQCVYHSTRKDGSILVKTYSDLNHYVQKVGTNEIYDEAIDVGEMYFEYGKTKYRPKFYNYVETNELIERVKEETINE